MYHNIHTLRFSLIYLSAFISFTHYFLNHWLFKLFCRYRTDYISTEIELICCASLYLFSAHAVTVQSLLWHSWWQVARSTIAVASIKAEYSCCPEVLSPWPLLCDSRMSPLILFVDLTSNSNSIELEKMSPDLTCFFFFYHLALFKYIQISRLPEEVRW